MTSSWVLLAVSVVGLLFALNALVPLKVGPFSVVSFFAGWLTSEMPLLHVLWQAIGLVVFFVLGAMNHWPGLVGLAIVALEWAILVILEISSQRSWTYISKGLGPLAEGLSPPKIRFSQSHIPVPKKGKDLEKLANLDYWGDAIHKHKLDIYRQKINPQSSALKPVLFYIHGGAWILGDKREQGLPMMYHMAKNGWVAVTVNYRLSPRSSWPDHIVDCKRALVWVKENIANYGGDPSTIVVSGGSAGGHLAALVGLSENDPTFQPGFETANTQVQGCVPIYGVYDFTNQDKVFAPGFVRFIEKSVFKKKLDNEPEVFQQASPYFRIHKNAPPFLVVAGRNDTLVPIREARRFQAKLKDTSESDVYYYELPLAQHAFEIFPSVRCVQSVLGIELFLNYVAQKDTQVSKPETVER